MLGLSNKFKFRNEEYNNVILFLSFLNVTKILASINSSSIVTENNFEVREDDSEILAIYTSKYYSKPIVNALV